MRQDGFGSHGGTEHTGAVGKDGGCMNIYLCERVSRSPDSKGEVCSSIDQPPCAPCLRERLSPVVEFENE